MFCRFTQNKKRQKISFCDAKQKNSKIILGKQVKIKEVKKYQENCGKWLKNIIYKIVFICYNVFRR